MSPLVKWTPSWDPFQEMEEMMQRLPVGMGSRSLSHGFVPAVDVYETKDMVMVEAPLAGIDPNDVEVHVEKGMLTISGTSNKEREVEEKNYYQKEVRSGSFYRQVPLPVAVKDDDVVAEYEDGILKIACPKASPTKAKKISVQVKKKQ